MKLDLLPRTGNSIKQWRSGWRIASKYGVRRDFLLAVPGAVWERFWLCRVHGQHQEKFGSLGRCYRCQRPMR